MTIDVEHTLKESRKRHNRDVWLRIALPIIVGLLVLILLTAFVSIMRSASQLAVSRNVIITLLVLCPLALCTLPCSIGLMTLAIISGRVHPWAKRPLRKGEAFTLRLRERAENYSDRAARWSISLNARITPLLTWMDRILSADASRTYDGRMYDDESPKRE